jgi:hypothetical protein
MRRRPGPRREGQLTPNNSERITPFNSESDSQCSCRLLFRYMITSFIVYWVAINFYARTVNLSTRLAASIRCYHGVVKPVVCEPLVALDARVPQ